MAVRFGVFVPQGWRLDLVKIDDPIAQFEAMTDVARVVDANPAWDSIWVYDHFHAVTASTRETLGMTYDEFSRTHWVGTSDDIVERLRPVIAAGIDYVIFSMPGVAYDHRPIQRFAREVIPQFAERA